MAKIKSRDTTPEVWFRKLLFAKGYRYRTNFRPVPGNPDMFLAKYNTAIFVNGCFWHRHEGCRYSYSPKSRIEFWTQKFQKNIERDIRVKNLLSEQGIKCLIVWECTIKAMRKSSDMKDNILQRVEDFLHSNNMRLEV